MDYLSLAVGFVVGAFTGAAGTYFGNKYTDRRRESEARSNAVKEFEYLRVKFPKLVDEMTIDVSKPEFSGVRIFFVKTKNTILNTREPHFVYFTDDHDDLSAALSVMVDFGYIQDITPGNCPKYRFYEHFYHMLRNGT